MSFVLPSVPPRFNGDLETWARQMDDYARLQRKWAREVDRMARDAIQEASSKDTYTVTNHTDDKDLDADASSAAVNADVIGSLIQTLITRKVIDGSVT